MVKIRKQLKEKPKSTNSTHPLSQIGKEYKEANKTVKLNLRKNKKTYLDSLANEAEEAGNLAPGTMNDLVKYRGYMSWY